MTTLENLKELENQKVQEGLIEEKPLQSKDVNENDSLPHCPPGWTKELWDKEMDISDHPFFMTPDQMSKNLEGNEMLQAQQAIKYDEDTQLTIENFYKEANQMFKDHYIKDKKNRFYIKRIQEKYTECILLEPEDKTLRSKILSNRSLINQDLKNYGRVIEDCTEAIKSDPTFVKPYYRMCQAYLALDKLDEAIKIAQKGLDDADSKNKDLAKISGEASVKLYQKKKLLDEKHKQKDMLKETKFLNLSKKGIVLGKKNTFPLPDRYSKVIKFDEKTNVMTTPVVFMYPEFSQFDYVEEATEDKMIDEIFGEIFEAGLPWDDRGYYKFPEDLECYVKLNCVDPLVPILDKNWDGQKGLLQISFQDTILEAITNSGYITPQIPEIQIVSKVSPYYNERFIKELF